jgi:hypothetical protein
MQRTTPERRNVARHWTLKRTHIALQGHAATIDCSTVLNLSDEGACLKVESAIGIPDSFDLVLDHAFVGNCRVTWRKVTRIGVAFA